MRIVFLNQFFADGAPTGQLLGDVAAELVRRGHEVTVIAGGTEYAATGYVVPQGVLVRRVPVMKFNRAPGARMLSWVSFLILSATRGMGLKRQDVVVSLTTPPALSVGAAALSKLWHARLWIWEMDVYPDVAISLGVVRAHATAIRMIAKLIDWSRRRAHGIIVLGHCMQERLTEHGLDRAKIMVSENWADSTLVRPHPQRTSGPLRVLYLGNLGVAHDVETVREVVAALGRDPRFEFHFAGGGAARAVFEEQCGTGGTTNVSFQSYCTAEELNASFAASDISLVTLRNECIGTVVPSKVYTALAAARPVLFIGPAGCESARLIERFGCGWVFQPGDVAGIAQVLGRLALDRSAAIRAGQNAHNAFLRHYDVRIGASRVADLIEQTEQPQIAA